MTTGQIAKMTIAVILGLVSAIFWSIGLQTLSVFMVATTIFHIFFVVGEEKKIVISQTEFESMFAKEMKKWKDSNLF